RGAQQRGVLVQDVLEGRLPPRELEFLSDALLVDVTDRQLCQQRREAEVVELRAQLCALDDVLEDVGLRRETRECADQSLDRQRREAGAARQRGVERLQVAF